MTTTSAGRTDAWTAPVGATTGRRVRYELIGCALNGHAVPSYRFPVDDDPSLVRRFDALVWHRCLRCDAWLPAPTDRHRGGAAQVPPAGRLQPGVGEPTVRDTVTPPLRGRLLRDRYLLRVIAVDRAVHVLVLGLLAVAIVVFARDRSGWQARVFRLVEDLQGGVGGPVRDSGHGLVHDTLRLFALGTGSLYAAAGVAIVYGLLETTEMVGLWRARRWAEYLTLIATVGLLPVEIYELTDSLSALKLLTFAINLAIAVYLLFAKRLFGLRGGGRRETAEREQDSGWAPIDRATPPVT